MSQVSNQFVDEISNACLAHLISEPELLGQFLGETGISPNELRAGVSDDIKMGMMDFFAHNEPAMLAVCANTQINIEQFMRAYYILNPSG